jgi:hypothetical protein
MAARTRVTLKDHRAFTAPGDLTFAKHLRLHSHEKQRYFEELASLPEDKRELRLDPGYINAMRRRWVVLYYGELSSAQYMGTAASHAPLELVEFITCCVCQQMDELHHSEMDRGVLEKIGLTDRDRRAIYEEIEAKAVFDHLLAIDDPFEIAVKGGLFLESASAVVAFPALIKIAEAHNDDLTAANHRTRLTDEPRHMALGVATMRALVEDDPRNQDVVQEWQDEFAPMLRAFVDASRDMAGLPNGGFSADGMWEAIVGHHTKNALKYGLRPTLSL